MVKHRCLTESSDEVYDLGEHPHVRINAEFFFKFLLRSNMILRSQAVASLIKTGRGRLEDVENLPSQKRSFTLIGVPPRNSSNSSTTFFTSKREFFS